MTGLSARAGGAKETCELTLGDLGSDGSLLGGGLLVVDSLDGLLNQAVSPENE